MNPGGAGIPYSSAYALWDGRQVAWALWASVSSFELATVPPSLEDYYEDSLRVHAKGSGWFFQLGTILVLREAGEPSNSVGTACPLAALVWGSATFSGMLPKGSDGNTPPSPQDPGSWCPHTKSGIATHTYIIWFNLYLYPRIQVGALTLREVKQLA